ncbi:MAG: hypothetical protein OXE40_15045 [Gammaproteobacteria bacterium]|nr:hypothetical protein [Gammaproteobacteria bacterium]
MKTYLSECFEIMTRTELEILRVAALLRRTALENLTLAERTELERLVLSIRNVFDETHSLEEMRHGWTDGLHRIDHSRASSDTAGEAARDLYERYCEAREYFYSAEVPWLPAIRRLAIMKAAEAEAPVTVVRHGFPRELPGSRTWTDDRSILGHAGFINRAPDFTYTAMTDANGRVLYSGISHSFFQSRPTVAEAAILGYADRLGLPFERVRVEVERLCSRSGSPVLHQDLALRELDDCFNAQGACGGFTELGQFAPRGFALADSVVHRGIARGIVAQALYSDPEKFARACSGETVDIELLATSILHLGDTSECEPQLSAFEALEESALALSMLDHKGHAHIVRANVRFLNIPLMIEDFGEDQELEVDSYRLCELLGPRGEPELSGELLAKIDAMKTRVSELRSSMMRELPSIRPAKKCLPEIGPVPNELRRLGEDSAYLERVIRTLEQAGMDFKAFRESGLVTHADDESIFDAAARIALIAHLTGRAPVLCGATGKDTVLRVESRIESLLSFAGAHEGNLPILLARALPGHGVAAGLR